MNTIKDVACWLNQQAPLLLGESWDNTGLLLGEWAQPVTRIITCLTLTETTTGEAIDAGAELVVAHHPLPFKPVSRITTDNYTGRLLWKLASHGVAVYSPHTAWDSAELGINALIARRLGLISVKPLVPSTVESLECLGSGRVGSLAAPATLAEIADRICSILPNCRPRAVDSGRPVTRIGIACGSGGSLLAAAVKADCELFLTGEATYHTCLEAEYERISMLMIGHFASEQFAMVELAERLSGAFPQLRCWASRLEVDPVKNLETRLPGE